MSLVTEALELKQIAASDIFLGVGMTTHWGRLFGGQILSQSLAAAAATVPDTHAVHSLHGYFILAGESAVPVVFSVERTRDGRSFLTRTVKVLQRNKTIFVALASFHRRETGLEAQIPLRDLRAYVKYLVNPSSCVIAQPLLAATGKEISRDRVPTPEDLMKAGCKPVWDHSGSTQRIQIAAGDRWNLCWMRHANPVDADWRVHCGVLAYMSDFGMVSTVKRFIEIQNTKKTANSAVKVGKASRSGKEIQDADPVVEWTTSLSLDHAIYFHRAHDVRCDKWSLIHCETLVGTGSRGLSRAEVFDQNFNVIASFQQEVLTRHRPRL